MDGLETLLNLAFLTVLLAVLSYGLFFLVKKPVFAKACAAMLAVCMVIGIVYLAWRGLRMGYFPFSNQFESLLVLLVLSIGLILFLYIRLERGQEVLLPAVIWAALGFAALSLLDRGMRPLMPALRSNWLFFHVFSSMLAYAAFAVAGIWSAVLLAQRAVAKSEAHLLQLARLGFGLLTIGIVTGSVWADRAWGRFWSWDPKETWSLITWMVYALAIHLHLRGWGRKKLAWMLIFGLLAVFFTYFGVNYLLGGLHSYA